MARENHAPHLARTWLHRLAVAIPAVACSDFRELARRRLPHFLFEYIDGRSYSEHKLARSVADLTSIELRQRVLREVAAFDPRVKPFGHQQALPIALGPIGLAGLNARRGEVQAARAVQAANIPFCLSTVSTCTIAEVAAATTAPFWFQLYVIRDRGFMRELLQLAEQA